jgi:hypothetical protein
MPEIPENEKDATYTKVLTVVELSNKIVKLGSVAGGIAAAVVLASLCAS